MSSLRRRSPFDHGTSEKIKSNMRMDRKPNASIRISDPSNPAGKRKEIDNVMKKARQQGQTNEYWDKKLLEVEERDPNRWKHTGYKKMYVNNNGRRSNSEDREKFRYRSRSPVRNMRKAPPSPRLGSRHQPSSPPMRRRFSKTPERRPRSPPPRFARRSPIPVHEMKSKEMYRSNKRPISPPPKLRSPSLSSCSDDSCSVCSDDGRRMISSKSRLTEHRHGPMNRMRAVSPELERVPNKKTKLKEISPKRRPKRVISPPPEKLRRPEVALPAKKSKDKADKTRTRVKVEGEKRRNRSPSSASDDSTSSEGSFTALTATTRMTLSERFGKMAQWNSDRAKYDMGNMKITKNSEGGDMKVMIQEGARQSPAPRPRYSPAPEGHYPEELLAHASAQAMGLGAWDDVRVRFDYYKSKGYLRDLTLQDYVKWEEWWYRYQEWLKQERYFEMWERNMQRRRRKKMPITQRLN